jgi:hypothetical protein
VYWVPRSAGNDVVVSCQGCELTRLACTRKAWTHLGGGLLGDATSLGRGQRFLVMTVRTSTHVAQGR